MSSCVPFIEYKLPDVGFRRPGICAAETETILPNKKKARGRFAGGPGDECFGTKYTEALSMHASPRPTVAAAGAGLCSGASLNLILREAGGNVKPKRFPWGLKKCLPRRAGSVYGGGQGK